MTVSNWKKVFKQLDAKPTIKKKYIKHNKPKDRAHGAANNSCRNCGRHKGHISKYGINMCRQCFRENAQELGFKKFR